MARRSLQADNNWQRSAEVFIIAISVTMLSAFAQSRDLLRNQSFVRRSPFSVRVGVCSSRLKSLAGLSVCSLQFAVCRSSLVERQTCAREATVARLLGGGSLCARSQRRDERRVSLFGSLASSHSQAHSLTRVASSRAESQVSFARLRACRSLACRSLATMI